MSITTVFKQREGLVWHGLAVIYAFGMYASSLVALTQPIGWPLRILAVVGLAHAMIIAAYLVHECAHNTIFKKIKYNTRLGSLLTWLCGANYGLFEDIRYKHFRHHADNDDVVWFDYEKFFREHPRTLATTRVLEFFYIPAHCLLMHVVMMASSFVIPQRRKQRLHNVLALVVRGTLFGLLCWYSPLAGLCYVIAYMLMIHVLRFMDSLQHDYEYHTNLFSGERSKWRGDKAYEQLHTFSVPLSLNYSFVNWLTLNFGYHNAHHEHPNQPWYRLPEIHRQMYANDPGVVIPFLTQVKISHRGRVERILKWDDDADHVPTPRGAEFLKAARAGEVTGGNAASFLTAI